MTQIPLFRSTDPSTSRDAAARVPEFRASHEAAIYAAICEAHPWGVTYREIAFYAGLEPVAVARRLVAMERRKLLGIPGTLGRERPEYGEPKLSTPPSIQGVGYD